jgi:hypothetical protein
MEEVLEMTGLNPAPGYESKKFTGWMEGNRDVTRRSPGDDRKSPRDKWIESSSRRWMEEVNAMNGASSLGYEENPGDQWKTVEWNASWKRIGDWIPLQEINRRSPRNEWKESGKWREGIQRINRRHIGD